MTPPPEMPLPGGDPHPRAARRPSVRTHTPRPDEITPETFEFITAVDEYKRRHLRSFLNDEEVLAILLSLGYALRGEAPPAAQATGAEVEAFVAARERYRIAEGRLFPTWSEVFQLLLDLGYRRRRGSAA
ncbi:MAG: hypothetical protein AB1726_06590 [Planctomycetota bacterium]